MLEARMAELADALDLGSNGISCAGSTPAPRTIIAEILLLLTSSLPFDKSFDVFLKQI